VPRKQSPPRTLFARNLQEAMKRRGATQESLASEIVGVKQPQVSKWARGLEYPKPHNLAAAAMALGVTADSLLDGLAFRLDNGKITTREKARGAPRESKPA
jgi:transcriptional regulator with XRE-family HTH domain